MERLTYNHMGCIELVEMEAGELCKERCNNTTNCRTCPIRKALEKLSMYEDLDERGRVIHDKVVGDDFKQHIADRFMRTE